MKKFSTFTHWTTEFANQGVFDDINRLTAFDEWHKWPSPKALQSLLPYEVQNLNNKTIEFVPQRPDEDFSAVAYEEVVYQSGQVPTRSESWHDIFGAITWSLFPKTKAVLNKLHHDDIQTNGKSQRSKLRNALTLFDECGVILVTKNAGITDLLANHQWHEAFVERRSNWFQAGEEGVCAYVFGHANYEMLTKPFDGLTGKWLHIDMSAELRSLPLNVQYRMIDEKLADKVLSGVLNDNSQLSPLPLLGVPSWYDKNEDADYYKNTDYFRPKRN